MADDLQVPPPISPAADTVRDQDKIMLFLGYFGIFGLIPFLTVKDSEYVKWHAKQGLTLTAAYVVGAIGIGIVATILGMVVHVLGAAFGCLGLLLFLGYFVVAVMGIVKSMAGERWRIPFIADLADRW